MTIRMLNDDTIGKIAAGEVVERPASVVKELIENALDAGSRRISVEISSGGVDLIEVSDDGQGMPADELPVAIQRHATSKLQSFRDLDDLHTLGFRGEALPSIGAVSLMSIRTRTAAEPVAAEIRVDHGDVGAVRKVAAPLGTTVTIRDLFGSVPARRKFLRQPSTESGYIARIVAAYAGGYPGVAFSLTTDGRRQLGTDGAGDYLGAAAGAFGQDAGKSALRLGPLDESAAVPGVEVKGWISNPSISRSHRQEIVFFVNGRMIQHRPLTYALEEAYHTLLMVGRHPVALVDITVDPASVDVNVHPTKAEVKFIDERAVCRAVQRAAHAALAQSPHDELPRVTFGGFDMTPRQPAMAIPYPSSNLASPHDPSMAEQTGETPPTSPAHVSGVPVLRVLGQVSGCFIIAEGPTGMYMIDQHAAHERVMYEKILGQMARRSVDQQPMLDPMVVELAPEEYAVFEKSAEELREIGFELEPFGEGAVVVRAIPALAARVDIAERLRLILGELADGGVGTSWLDSVAISAACHTSIRAGQTLSMPEMRELVAELERCQQPRACGHGRPTMLHMTRGDLEKQFRR